MHRLVCVNGHAWQPDNDARSSPEERWSICPQCGGEVDALSLNPSAGNEEEKIVANQDNDSAKDAAVRPQIPGYKILGEIGWGGMGVVYKARQLSVNRLVALKMISAEATSNKSHRARFQTEVMTLAQLRHPNIVQIYEAGEHAGQPYLTMEFIRGGSLDQRLGAGPVSSHDAAVLVKAIANGVQAAHQVGIVHRDLKPANILLDGLFTGPISDCTPKITDFHLAKRLDDNSDKTRMGTIVGTPSYMSPEQAASRLDDVGPLSDVYSLGAILYEALTGIPPFRGVTPLETVEQVRKQEPVPPRQLQPKLPRDIETICLKCLLKEPQRRYASSEKLAEDLDRFLNNEPILARPTSSSERMLRWAKRNPTVSTLSALLLLVFVAGVIGVAMQWRRAESNASALAEKNAALVVQAAALERQTNRASALAASEAETRTAMAFNLYAAQMNLVQRAFEERDFERMELLLASYIPRDSKDDLRTFVWYYWWQVAHEHERTITHDMPIRAVALSPDGRTLAVGGGLVVNDRLIKALGLRPAQTFADKAELRLWNPETGQLLATLDGHSSSITSLAFSADGRTLASASNDKTVRLWDLNSRESIRTLELGHPVTAVALSSDGKLLAAVIDLSVIGNVSGSTQISLWDLVNGRERNTIQPGLPALQIAFSPDSKSLAWANLEHAIGICDIESGVVSKPFNIGGSVRAVAFSADGRSIIAAGGGGAWPTLALCDRRTGELHQLKGHQVHVWAVASSANAMSAVTGGYDGTLNLWDMKDGRLLKSFSGHSRGISSLAITPDGKCIASASVRQVRIWRVDQSRKDSIRASFSFPLIAVSPNSRRLVSLERVGLKGCSVAFYNLDHSRGIAQSARDWKSDSKRDAELDLGGVLDAAFSPDGSVLATGHRGKTARLWDPETGEPVVILTGHEEMVDAVTFSEDSQTLCTASFDMVVKKWSVRTHEVLKNIRLVASAPVSSMKFTPGGRGLITGHEDGTFQLWNVEAEQVVRTVRQHTGTVACLAVTSDGRRLATAGEDGTKVWDLDEALSVAERCQLRGQARDVRWLDFSPDGKTLAMTSSRSEFIELWDTTTGERISTLKVGSEPESVAFSADGCALYSAAGGRANDPQFGFTVRIWRAATENEVTTRTKTESAR